MVWGLVLLVGIALTAYQWWFCTTVPPGDACIAVIYLVSLPMMLVAGIMTLRAAPEMSPTVKLVACAVILVAVTAVLVPRMITAYHDVGAVGAGTEFALWAIVAAPAAAGIRAAWAARRNGR